MCTTPILAMPNFTKTFVLECDAFRKGIGALLMQERHLLFFINYKLFDRNLGKSIYENEMLVIFYAVDMLCP
jgi:hypothetical protein